MPLFLATALHYDERDDDLAITIAQLFLLNRQVIMQHVLYKKCLIYIIYKQVCVVMTIVDFISLIIVHKEEDL